MARRAGVLVPLFSLRTPHGFGLGEIPDLAAFAGWAQSAGFSVVQMLPVNDTAGQVSPYSAASAFAIDPVYASLAAMPDFHDAGGENALSSGDRDLLEVVRGSPGVRWAEAKALKLRALRLAFAHFEEHEWVKKTPRAHELIDFSREHDYWLEDYLLWSAIHEREQFRPWMEWPEALAHRDEKALNEARAALQGEILFKRYVQWQLDRQWREAKRAAAAFGVELMGDLPFMVSGDSADVWSRPGDFRMDARVGVPPDAFSADGQDWGLPVYRWEEMQKSGYPWMKMRAQRGAELFGLYRVDHVVGLYRTYYREGGEKQGKFIPGEEPAQTQNGESVIRILATGAQVIAEDLGVVPDFVRASLTRLGVPGYRVLRWEKDQAFFRDPARWPALSVATTGTHDTESLADWYEAMPDDERRHFLEDIPGNARLRQKWPARFDDFVRDQILELVYASGSDLALLPLQDLLGWRERVNVPGTVGETNWTWRMPRTVEALAGDAAVKARLAGLAARTGRFTAAPAR